MTGTPLLLASLAAPAPGAAQQVVEIDYTSGRTIIDDEWRAMRSRPVTADWESGKLYVKDPEEPDGIMIFSLETGEHLHTISIRKGDGPFELSDGWFSLALTDDGGLHVSGMKRIITYDSAYQAVSSWTPRAPASQAVCNLGGRPAVPLRHGVLRYENEAIGPGAVSDTLIHLVGMRSGEEVFDIGMQTVTARMVCTDDMAIVVPSYRRFRENELATHTGQDSLLVYRVDGTAGHIPLPAEYIDDDCVQKIRIGDMESERPCPPWTANLQPSFDGRGNLVLSSYDKRIAGAVIDIATGCHTIVRKDVERDMHLRMVAVRGDSVLVFHNDKGVHDGKPTVFANSAVKASVHPVRRVSGEPCPGMLSG